MRKVFLGALIVILLYFVIKPDLSILPLPWNKMDTATCKLVGNLSKDKVLEEYTVQEGDTLLSIATDKLGDSTKVEDIIAFNKDKYPNLSMDNPYLVAGWKIYIPPKNAAKSVDDFSVAAGKVIKTDDTSFTLAIKQNEITFRPNENTRYQDVKPLEKGDCVKVGYNPKSMQIYTVGLQ